MVIVHVQMHVNPEAIAPFIQATLANARNSIIEPGVARFDLIQRQDVPTRFTLVEVYHTSEDPGRHKQTPLYQLWRDTVADMMAEPRSSEKYINLFPNDEDWI